MEIGIGVSETFVRNGSWCGWLDDIEPDNSRTAYQIWMNSCLYGLKIVWRKVQGWFGSSEWRLDHDQYRYHLFCDRSQAPLAGRQDLRRGSTKHAAGVSLVYDIYCVSIELCPTTGRQSCTPWLTHQKDIDINASFSRQGGHWRLIRVVDWCWRTWL